MKKATLKIVRTVRYPFYHAMVEAREEQFLDDEFKIVWDEAESQNMNFTLEDRVELLKMLTCIKHLYHDGVDYFYCLDLDAYWEELSILIDAKGK
ncbi:hypothetical protein [Ammoniphilus sp. CFH 90114]|uniref:hypothetical protein n=1 Tax=Ammoniphilus sp. CFH 90114 TaxID=2493665 RepID=UPI00100ECE51|nr:hypothetical protein [Ammoniphilus sp. CFH 90114]RXT13860.1 hypothetical protein EIZ39_06890 [Ammoniphilus sp. CFH 90114]